MEKYIRELFGTKVKLVKWDGYEKMPYYLIANRTFYKMETENFQCVVIKMNIDKFSVVSYIKQEKVLEKYIHDPIVLWFDGISSYQRQILIKNQIAFVVPGTQLYIPMLGMSFCERFAAKKKRQDKMTAVAQTIILWCIYSTKNNLENKEYRQSEISLKLKLSPMDTSRGVQELQELGLLSVEKKGKYNMVRLLKQGKELYELSKKYMQSPIQKRIYILRSSCANEYQCVIAGEDALARRTMLNPPRYAVKAVDRKVLKTIPQNAIVEPEWLVESEFIELELWKYDPKIFADNNIVDPISLSLSLEQVDDERVEEQLEQMWKEYEW